MKMRLASMSNYSVVISSNSAKQLAMGSHAGVAEKKCSAREPGGVVLPFLCNDRVVR